MLKEEMERKREKEEEGLYVAPRSFTVEKDW